MTEERSVYGSQNQAQDEIDLVKVFLALWNHKWIIIGVTVFCTVMAVIYALTAQPYYKSSVSVYQVKKEKRPASMGSLQTMASQFGVSGLESQMQYSIPDIVKSNYLNEKLVEQTWSTEKFEQPVNLITYFEIEEGTQYEKKQAAIGKMKGMISHQKSEETGLTTISVLMPNPQLAAKIANKIPKLIRTYINQKQKTNTRENIVYIKERLNSIKQELEAAEERVKQFRESHRMLSQSPELQLQLQRLQREVTIKEQVYLTLQKEKEKAQIDLAKKKPVINILDEARVPLVEEKPKKKLIVIVGGFAGVFIGVLMVVIKFVLAMLKREIEQRNKQ